MPSSRRTGATCFMARWWRGANMKPMPASAMQRLDLRRRDVDGHAQRLEDVGAAAPAGRRAVAVLGHRDAGAGGDERRRRGDVEGAGAVAAGAAGVEDDVGVDVDLLGELGHGARHADDLLGGLALDAQRAEEGGRLGFAGTAAHDLEQHAAGLVLAQVAAAGEALAARRSGRHSASRPPSHAGRLRRLSSAPRRSGRSCRRKLRSRSSADLGEHALGVELHAVDRQLAVAHAHHDALVVPGAELQAVRAAPRRRPASGSAWP